jgi:eukaryotic-like serine/threonine-protein kinase
LLLPVACTIPGSSYAPHEEMVLVPAGAFIMGTDLSTNDADATPAHIVQLEAFWIDQSEVTNAKYRGCIQAGGCPEPHDLRFYDDPTYADHPVVFVTWYAAQDYCRWAGKRLPTEAEWEKAARGEVGFSFPWGDEFDPGRLNAGQQLEGTAAVGSYPQGASPYGALDMAGNVWEWVADWYAAYPGSSYRSDFYGEKYKLVRGGSWNHPVEDAHSYHRDIAHPGRALAVVGFRCVSR